MKDLAGIFDFRDSLWKAHRNLYLGHYFLELFMKKLLSLAVFLLLFVANFHAQNNLSALTLSQELKNNANAVVREDLTEVIVEDIDRLTTKYRTVVTILNKVGHRQFSDMLAYYDEDSKIRKISARIYNVAGQEIKKYSKSKFTDVSAVDGGTLYADDRVLYVDYTPIAYPYTFVFEVERSSRTTGFIPNWRPLNSFYLAIENSRYRFVNKSDSEIRTKEVNFEGYNIKKETLENGFEYEISNLKALRFESYTPYLKSFCPELKVALTDFSLKGVEGHASNWKEFGKWMHEKLIKGKALLPQVTKDKVLALVKDVNDPLEKAKLVYQFMQDKTRYISVQVGIGGWEPIAANQVDKVGYGDCKGLTNYMKALLDVVGVTSYYSVVHANEQFSIDEDFASIEGNHVILNMPYKGEDIWLECTSQTIPFGFLGKFTDDRRVLVVTPEGGVLKQTVSYVDQDNLQETKASIQMTENGDLKAKVVITSKGIEYNSKYALSEESFSELKKHYKSNRWSYNNNLEVSKAVLKNEKDSLKLTEHLEVSIPDYAARGESELLLRMNVFNRNTHVPKRYRNRKLSMEIPRGYLHKDEFKVRIPEGYQIQELPLPKVLKTKFGEYVVSVKKMDDKTFVYNKSMLIKKGTYSKEDYDAYRKFRKSIAKYENSRISLTKTQ